MDWYEQASEACADAHIPEDWDGREWDELTDKERWDAINEQAWSVADASGPQ